MTPKKAIDVALCGDCIYTDANGWDEKQTGQPLPTPEPMSLLRGYLIAPTTAYDCEGHFSRTPCQGCGQTLAGIRYCYIAVPTRTGFQQYRAERERLGL